jgi:hypothetical protein
LVLNVRSEDLPVVEYPLRIRQSARPYRAIWPKVAVDDGYLSNVAANAAPKLDPLATGPGRLSRFWIGLSIADHVFDQLAPLDSRQDLAVEKSPKFREG